MSNVIPIALATHYASGSTTVADALRITRPDGVVLGFTGATKSVTIGGVFYDATQGLDVTSISASAGLAVDNLELTTLDDGTLFTRADVIGKVWQNSKFLIFRYNWASPTDGVENVLSGTIGQVRLLNGAIVCELRGLQQYLQQPVGAVTSKTCRARFADFPSQSGNARCGIDVTTWTDLMEVTAVISRRQFVVQALGTPRPDGHYSQGLITWTTGANTGLRAQVKDFRDFSPVDITLYTDAPRTVVVGDRFEAVAGCRHRRAEDCRDRFNNVVNFQGEPDVPGVDELTKTPEASA